MAHPFTKMFDVALRKSTDIDNQVFKVAEGLRQKGYSDIEIATVLEKLEKSLIDQGEAAIVREALVEFRGEED